MAQGPHSDHIGVQTCDRGGKSTVSIFINQSCWKSINLDHKVGLPQALMIAMVELRRAGNIT